MTDPGPSHPPRPRRLNLAPFDGQWTTLVVDLPDELIQQVCVIIEGYENLAQVRTPVKQGGRVHITTNADNLDTIHRILVELSTTIPLQIVDQAEGALSITEHW